MFAQIVNGDVAMAVNSLKQCGHYITIHCLRYVVMLKGKQLRVLRLPVLQE